MKITKTRLHDAANFTTILYYPGGLVAIGATTLFMNLGWEEFGGWGILCIALVYAGIGPGIVWQRKEQSITRVTRRLLPVALQELLAERKSRP
jgi:hypothetical protein